MEIVEQDDRVRLVVAGVDAGLRLRPLRRDTLTLGEIGDLPAGSGWIVRFRRASPDAKRAMRERRINYASDGGEVFVLDPPVAISQSAPREAPRAAGGRGERGPFAVKASRVSRWLLLHPRETFNVRQLARHTQLSEGAVSTTVRDLHDRLLVDVGSDPADARARRVRVVEPMRLLGAWERVWEVQRVRSVDWDIGTTSVEETLQRLAEAASVDESLRWAVGGTAAAAKVARAVEPAEALVWIGRNDLPDWEEILVPLPARGRRGTLRMALAPDPYLFDLVEMADRIPIADRVQIYLDTTRAGERGLEAADAVRRVMRW